MAAGSGRADLSRARLTRMSEASGKGEVEKRLAVARHRAARNPSPPSAV